MGVVKADAYGHGAVPVALRLQAEKIDALGVARIEEGVELRIGGVKTPIFILSGVFEPRADELVEYELTPILYDLQVAKQLNAALDARGAVLDFHLKVDTGMSRVGVAPAQLPRALEVLGGLSRLRLTGLLTHFAESEAEDAAFTESQLTHFRDCLQQANLPRDLTIHTSNSGAIFLHEAAHYDMVRPGIVLYGSVPDDRLAKDFDVRPVMRLVTRVIHVKEVPAGTPISYGRAYVTERPTAVATLAIGYGDGYSRALTNRGHVLIRGQRAPIVGAVCMDLTMVDVTGVSDVAVGDEAVVLGADGDDRISAEEIASLTGTIPYEVYTAVSKRVPRVYTGRQA